MLHTKRESQSDKFADLLKSYGCEQAEKDEIGCIEAIGYVLEEHLNK